MKQNWKNILFSKYSLLAFSVILFSLSLAFSKLYTNRSSVVREVKIAEKYITRHEKDFQTFLKDTSLIRELILKKQTARDFKRLTDKKYGIFIYTANDLGNVYMRFWSDQLAVPPPELFAKEDGEGFQHLSNGYYVTVKHTFSLNSIGEKIIAVALIPIRSEYFIETDYLPTEFAHSETAEKKSNNYQRSQWIWSERTGRAASFLLNR